MAANHPERTHLVFYGSSLGLRAGHRRRKRALVQGGAPGRGLLHRSDRHLGLRAVRGRAVRAYVLGPHQEGRGAASEALKER